MTYNEFADQVKRAGLIPKMCRDDHWQIRGGKRLVNFWPNAKGGSKYYVDNDERSHRGSLDVAIRKAGPSTLPRRDETPPWEKPSVERVGLIRWLWRLIW